MESMVKRGRDRTQIWMGSGSGRRMEATNRWLSSIFIIIMMQHTGAESKYSADARLQFVVLSSLCLWMYYAINTLILERNSHSLHRIIIEHNTTDSKSRFKIFDSIPGLTFSGSWCQIFLDSHCVKVLSVCRAACVCCMPWVSLMIFLHHRRATTLNRTHSLSSVCKCDALSPFNFQSHKRSIQHAYQASSAILLHCKGYVNGSRVAFNEKNALKWNSNSTQRVEEF